MVGGETGLAGLSDRTTGLQPPAFIGRHNEGRKEYG